MNEKQMIIKLITTREADMALPHRWNARKRHLGASTFEKAPFNALAGYLNHLITAGPEGGERAERPTKNTLNKEVRHNA